LVDGVPLMVGVRFVLDATVIVKAGSAALVLPSLTEMTMPSYFPACDDVGVPESLPVAMLNVAHDGLLDTLNVSVSRSRSDALGVKD
jgi:hypothetical protein